MISRKFKFNISEKNDIFGNSTKDFTQNIYETSNGTVTPQKDDIELNLIEGNGTEVNRTPGSQHLKVRVFDKDKGENALLTSLTPETARIWVTNDNSNNFVVISQSPTRITNGGFINTTSSGFDPNCSFSVGPQKWKAGTTVDNDYYKATNSTEYNITIVTQSLVYVIKEPLNGVRFLKNSPNLIDNIPIQVNVSDDCGLVDGADVTILECKYKRNKTILQ
jgi:preprotein translocase subunit SecD